MAYNRNSKHRNNDRYQGDKKNSKRNSHPRNRRPVGSGKRPSNASVYLRDGDDPMRAIKRFMKICKKERIVEACRDRQAFVKPSAKRRLAEKKRQQTLAKVRREQNK